MFCTWCELSHKTNKKERGALKVWVSPHSGGSVTSHQSSQYHQHSNALLLLAKQKTSKVAFNKSLLSKAGDPDLVNNKFNIVKGGWNPP
jgi:hypothetical protein